MKPESLGLRRRLALALAALTGFSALLLGLTFWISESYIEKAMIGRLMHSQLKLIAATNADPAAFDALSTELRYYRPAQRPPAAPKAVQALEPDHFERITLKGREYQALAVELAPGDRAYLLYDLSAYERRENWVLASLLLAVGLIAGVAVWISGTVAERTLLPVATLTRRLRGLDPEIRNQRLASDVAYGELGAVVEAVNAHLAALDAHVARETAFAAAASHELRTPIAVIHGAAEVLAGRPPEPQRVLARILRASAQARDQLEALLAISRHREPPPRQTLHLSELLPALAEPYLAEAREQNTQLHWHDADAGACQAAPGAVGIVFTNLLRNALKAARGGHVTVRIGRAAFSVEDDGPGLPIDGDTLGLLPLGGTPGGGSGMGLYVSATLARRFGWRLSFAARDGGGTRARLELEPAPEPGV